MQKFFDAHFHIIDPAYPLAGNQGYRPDFYTVSDYKEELTQMGIQLVGGALTSGSFQGYDQTYLQGGLSELGEGFVGITQVSNDISDREILSLDKIGIKGIRFNLFRGLDQTLGEIDELARRVYDLAGWKSEFYIDLARARDDLLTLIKELPATSIDHLGMSRVDFSVIEDLLKADVAFRLTGFGRVDYSREEIVDLAKKIISVKADGLFFGSDLPSTRAKYRFSRRDLDLVLDHFSSEEAERILYKNAYDWYLN